MASNPPPPSALLALHAKAVANFTAKTTRVRFHRPPGLSTLSIDDIYAASSRTRVSSCPPDLDLAFLFNNHNILYRLNKAVYPKPSTQEDFDIIRAIWFWGIGKCHSFMWIRENDAAPFVQAFIAAWLEGTHTPHIFTARERFIEIWAQGEFELICFSARKHKSTSSALQEGTKELDAKAIIVSFEEDEFVEQMRGLSEEEVWDIGPAMAGRWAFLNVQKMRDGARQQAGGIEGLFGDFSIDDKPSAMSLELVDWNGELVSAVLKDIDDGVQQKKAEKNEGAYWIDETVALRILRSQKVDDEAAVAGGDGDVDAMEE